METRKSREQNRINICWSVYVTLLATSSLQMSYIHIKRGMLHLEHPYIMEHNLHTIYI